MHKRIDELLDFYRDDIIRDIAMLVRISSVYDAATRGPGIPFGLKIREAFNFIQERASAFSLICEDFDGYALHIEYGDAADVLGILTHTDVVPCRKTEHWDSDPYELTHKDDFLIGRGVTDNKASVVGCLYLIRILKELGYKPTKKIRLIVGGAEETSWECIRYYLEKNKSPDIAFSPDCDFPVVNCEKGILRGKLTKSFLNRAETTHTLILLESEKSFDFTLHQQVVKVRTKDAEQLKDIIKFASSICFEDDVAVITYEAKQALSRNPDRTTSAAYLFACDFDKIEDLDDHGKWIIAMIKKWFPQKPYGQNLDLCYTDHLTSTGYLTLACCYVYFNQYEIEMGFDLRYPNGIESNEIRRKLYSGALLDHFDLDVVKNVPRLYVSQDSHLVSKLLDAYETVTGDRPTALTKGGMSYSRALPNCVGFGPTFLNETPNPHSGNENINVLSLFKALRIYAHAILLL